MGAGESKPSYRYASPASSTGTPYTPSSNASTTNTSATPSSSSGNGEPEGNSGTYVVCGLACILLVGLLVYVFMNRKDGPGVPGCEIIDVGGAGSLPEDITTNEHHQQAANSSNTIVVHHSVNCGYCKKLRPVITAVGKALGLNVVFSEVNSTPANQSAFQSLDGVTGVPCYTKNGTTVVGVGYMQPEPLKVLLQSKML